MHRRRFINDAEILLFQIIILFYICFPVASSAHPDERTQFETVDQ